jgi:hypothetical protein
VISRALSVVFVAIASERGRGAGVGAEGVLRLRSRGAEGGVVLVIGVLVVVQVDLLLGHADKGLHQVLEDASEVRDQGVPFQPGSVQPPRPQQQLELVPHSLQEPEALELAQGLVHDCRVRERAVHQKHKHALLQSVREPAVVGRHPIQTLQRYVCQIFLQILMLRQHHVIPRHRCIVHQVHHRSPHLLTFPFLPKNLHSSTIRSQLHWHPNSVLWHSASVVKTTRHPTTHTANAVLYPKS